jgi:hypothetical protein
MASRLAHRKQHSLLLRRLVDAIHPALPHQPVIPLPLVRLIVMPTPRARHSMRLVDALGQRRVVHDRKHRLDLVLGDHGELAGADVVHCLQRLKRPREETHPVGRRAPLVAEAVGDDELAVVRVSVGALRKGDLVKLGPLVGVGEATVLQLLVCNDLRDLGGYGGHCGC